jgi:hypothetical protein
MNDLQRLLKMNDETVQDVWDAIWEIDDPDRRPDVEWQELVYSEITRRGLRSGPRPII